MPVLSWARFEFPRAPRFILPSLLLASVLLTTLASEASCLAVSDSGRWTPPDSLTGTAVHMALLPGHGPYHSKVMWWYGLGHDDFFGGLLGWKPGEYNCGSYPDTTFLAPITLPMPDSSGVFCSSESHLADGRLFLAGGTQPGTEYGTKHAYIFDPRSIQWTKKDSMSAFRWYPTSTTLADGRQLVTSGSQHQHIEFFGGLRGSEGVPRDKGLFRYGVGANGVVDSAVYTGSGPVWPKPREGHGWAFAAGVINMFGGRDSVDYFNEYTQLERGPKTLGSDYDYVWRSAQLQNSPPARWDHSVVATPDTFARMIVFGGIAKNENQQPIVTSDVWRLKWVSAGLQGWTWFSVSTSGSEAPGLRCGHAAIWRPDGRRMLVFGGRGSTSGSPTDSALYSLTFSADYSTAAWEKLSATGPSPRLHSGIGSDPDWLRDDAYVFGGEITGGQNVNDLWRLNLSALTWTDMTNSLTGPFPSPRSRHTTTLAANLLYVFGGKSTDDTMYVAHIESMHDDEQMMWTTFRRHTPTLSGHTAIFWPGAIFERRQEIFDPTADSGSQWSLRSSAPRWQNWYPQMFVWKPDTLFDSGPDELTYKYAIASPSWQQYPGGTPGFRGGSAVMYRPGKVMKCGSRDIDGGFGPSAVGTTKRIDLDAGSTASWVASANNMLARVNHNLVMLPNGKVLVVGGTSVLPGTTASAEKRPEIWDPDNSGGIGAWFGRDTLAPQHEVRDYHSTALLLPDGRIISAGGNALTQKDVEIFCPPYLFKSDGSLATRPAPSGSPQRVRYGAQFSICLSASDSISKVCLIRPAAVTHGFDENQRYVPLTFTPANLPTARLTVTAPPDSFQAPPGDYMLFLVNKRGVPSIARWLRMGYSWSDGDVTRPARITDLATDLLTCNSVSLYWTAVGDDGATGVASYADLRRSTSPIDSLNFGSATPVNPQPVPVCPGTLQFHNVTGLAHNTTYYFAIKFSDESGNVSLFGNTASATTLDDCGVGTRAVLAREGGASAIGAGEGDGTSGASPFVTTGAGATSGGSPVVVDAVPQTDGIDVKIRPVTDGSVEGHAQAGDTGVLILTRDDSGQWTTGGQHDLPPGNGLALPVPDRATRWVFLEPLRSEKVLVEVGPGWTMEVARHSTEGDVTDALIGGATPSMSVGDTLSVHYSASASPSSAPSWMIMMSRTSSGAAGARAGGRRQDRRTGAPQAFALRQNQPNPFDEITSIGFALPTPSRVKLEIFDVLGRRVRVLANATFPAGEQQLVWNRRTAGGAVASPGLYFYTIAAGQFHERRRMIILP